MISFWDILQTDGPILYEESTRGHLKMKNHAVPFSIMEAEFDFIHNTILDNNLRCGFEVATAFGISALAAASAFKETGGMLVSMDAYVEEIYNDAGAYETTGKEIKEGMPDGLVSAQFLSKHFNTEDHVRFTRGWSPDDTGDRIAEHHGQRLGQIDYVFIDAGHFTEWIRNDITAVAPFIGERAAVFFHDVYPESFTPELIEYIEKLLGNKLEVVLEYPQGENLGLVRIGL